MSDLIQFGMWCSAKAVEHDCPEDERRLWLQIAEEIDAWVHGGVLPTTPGLFAGPS